MIESKCGCRGSELVIPMALVCVHALLGWGFCYPLRCGCLCILLGLRLWSCISLSLLLQPEWNLFPVWTLMPEWIRLPNYVWHNLTLLCENTWIHLNWVWCIALVASSIQLNMSSYGWWLDDGCWMVVWIVRVYSLCAILRLLFFLLEVLWQDSLLRYEKSCYSLISKCSREALWFYLSWLVA